MYEMLYTNKIALPCLLQVLFHTNFEFVQVIPSHLYETTVFLLLNIRKMLNNNIYLYNI